MNLTAEALPHLRAVRGSLGRVQSGTESEHRALVSAIDFVDHLMGALQQEAIQSQIQQAAQQQAPRPVSDPAGAPQSG